VAKAPARSIADKLAGLSELTIFELRAEWRCLHRMPPPMRLSRDLLFRGIAYKIQEQAYGGLSKATRRRLATPADRSGEEDGTASAPPIVLKPGTKLIREWRGVTYSVLVQKGGFEWRGQRYASLTLISQEITGAHWSGPRFFGLAKRRASATQPADAEHVQK
jgi:hypothetical protein